MYESNIYIKNYATIKKYAGDIGVQLDKFDNAHGLKHNALLRAQYKHWRSVQTGVPELLSVEDKRLLGMIMPAEVITAALSLVGTLVGTLGGIALSSNLTNYRIEQLEKKVEKHNNLITRTYKLEQEFAVMDEKVKVANHRIDDLEDLEHES